MTKITIKATLAKAAMSALGMNESGKSDTTSGNMSGGIFGLLGSLGGMFTSGTSGGIEGAFSDMGFSQNSIANGSFGSLEEYDKIFGAMMNHTGGIVGKEGMTRMVTPEMFAGATKYHDGGVAGLKSDEVPTILQKGEGVFTKEQMKAMGNSKANVTVNVINNTQEQVTAQQSQPRFDGEKMILDVVLKNMNQPGSFRDGMTGAMR